MVVDHHKSSWLLIVASPSEGPTAIPPTRIPSLCGFMMVAGASRRNVSQQNLPKKYSTGDRSTIQPIKLSMELQMCHLNAPKQKSTTRYSDPAEVHAD